MVATIRIQFSAHHQLPHTPEQRTEDHFRVSDENQYLHMVPVGEFANDLLVKRASRSSASLDSAVTGTPDTTSASYIPTTMTKSMALHVTTPHAEANAAHVTVVAKKERQPRLVGTELETYRRWAIA